MKKLELLRELDDPKVGDIVTSTCNHVVYKIEAIVGDQLCISTPDASDPDNPHVYLESLSKNRVRQNPLFWLEDTPIYKGDTVYIDEDQFTVDSAIFHEVTCEVLVRLEEFYGLTHVAQFTLTKPKVKKTKWMNIYDTTSTVVFLHDSKELADKSNNSIQPRVACIEVSWEE